MKVIKLLGITLLGLVLSTAIQAQNSNTGIELLRLGEYDLAKQYFTENPGSDKAKSLYYQGEVAWEQENLAEAKKQYAKALESDPTSPYAIIGTAKAELKTNKDAKKEIENAYKKNKKDIAIVVEAAKAFYDNGMKEEGDKAIEEARKSDLKSPLIYILLGDIELKNGKPGDAAMQYDQAINFDNNNVLALIKAGKVYENINKDVASKNLKRALDVDPTNRVVNRYLAKIYSQSGRYGEAIKIYDNYFKDGNYNLEDIRYYSNALYFNKDYNKAKEILQLGLGKDNDDFVFNRLMMYTQNELKDYQGGLKTGEHLFTLRSNQDEGGYLDKDYVTYGSLLAANGMTEEAMVAYTKAIELNPKNAELYKDLAATMAQEKLNEGAAQFQEQYIQAIGDEATATDYYQLGRYLQSAGTAIKDTIPEAITRRTDLLNKASEAFGILIEKRPDNYLGYFMQAGVKSTLDPQLTEGLAKPLYEKTIELITADNELDQRKNIVATAYEYLAVYYYYQFLDTKSPDAKAKAKEYCDLALAINPNKDSIIKLSEAINE